MSEVFTTYPTPDVAPLLERTCRRCPVRLACRAFADEHQPEGTWAGTWRSGSTGSARWLGDVA